jgi:N4-gp56 family major capsid protein
MGAFTWEGSFSTGVLKSHALSKELRYAAVAEFEVAQFCRPEPGFGRKLGDTITITKIKNLTVPTSAALSEHEDIPIDTLSIGTTGITVEALGRGVEYTSLADELSFFDLKTPIQKKLRDQLAAVNDSLAATAFKTSYVIAVPTSSVSITWDTDGTLSTIATNNINITHCGVIRDYMRDTLNVPFYEKGHYIGLGSTKLLRGIKSDPDFQTWRQWLRPGDVLFNSEVGMIEQIRWIEINNTSALSKAKGVGSVLGEGLVFGEDGVALAEVETPELRAAIPGNFGRYQAVAWYGVLAYGLIWNATATAGEARVVYITGNAA